MSEPSSTPMRVRWARLRLAIVGPLLGAPPSSGELKQAIDQLAARTWPHPTTGESIRFSSKTIERWFYLARNEQNPFDALARKVPKHAGTHPSVSEAVAEQLRLLRRQHPRWTFRLVYDNLVVLGRQNPALGVLPTYSTVCRFMKREGLLRHRVKRHEREPGFVARERRSYEVSHADALWHFDFHACRRKVTTASGELCVPQLCGILDDYSRLCCHLQWYLQEDTEALVHGLSQASQKRGLPREIQSRT